MRLGCEELTDGVWTSAMRTSKSPAASLAIANASCTLRVDEVEGRATLHFEGRTRVVSEENTGL